MPHYALLFALSLGLALAPGLSFPDQVSSAQAQVQRHMGRVISVETTAQLLQAIGPNRTILLKPNTYDLSVKAPATAYLEYDPQTGGPVIKNVKNLRLIGSDVRATKVVINSPAAHVLSFKNSSGIQIRSLEFGHIPQSNTICLGAVLGFESSHGIQLSDVNLFGSGTFGLWLENTHNLRLDNSVIKECSQGIAFLSGSRQITFSNSTFVNNDGGLNIWDNSQAVVSGSRFVHNHAERSRDYSKALFEVKYPGQLLVSHSRLNDNTATGLLTPGGGTAKFQSNYMNRNRYSPVTK